MLENSWYKKENPFLGLTGMGGGVGSNLVLFGGSNRDQLLLDREGVATNSLRFNNQGAGWPASSGDSAYLSKVFGTPTNTKIWTFSTWFKKSINGDYCALFNGVWVGGQGRYGYITIDNNDQLTVFLGQYPNGNPDYIYFTSSQKLIDTSAWYHICVAVDTTQATESDRFSAYINGVEVTSWDVETYPDQNEVYHINNNDSSGHMIGAIKNTVNTGHSRWGNGYQAETIFIDGQKKAASDFGETDATTGQWIPKAYAGTYGNNGVHLKYDNTSDLGEDSSGNGNDWSAINFSTSAGAGNDVLDDSPSTYDYGNGVGNYCTLNPLDNNGLTLSNGSLDASRNTNTWATCKATFGLASDKWYFEYTVNSGASNQIIGVFKTEDTPPDVGAYGYMTYSTSGWGYQLDGNKANSNSFTATGTTAGVGDNIMVAVDVGAGKVWFGVNGTWLNSGDPANGSNAAFTNLSGSMSPAVCLYGTQSGSINFGQRPFEETVPTNFKALNTFNLDAPLIDDPSDHFDVRSGLSAQFTVNDINFEADLIVGKSTSNSEYWIWADAVRGFDKPLKSDTNTGEGSGDAYTSVGSSGYSSDSNWFTNGRTYTTWAWNAGSSTVTNNAGSIQSEVRASTTAGFSIVSWTDGTQPYTVGHGLNAAGLEPPSLIILKSRSTGNWPTYHASLGNQSRVYLNLPLAASSGEGCWNNTSPTSSVFSVGSSGEHTGDMIAYCWSEVEDYSKFSLFEGNGGEIFIHTGFKPEMLIIKQTDGGNNSNHWYSFDTERSSYLLPSSDASEPASDFTNHELLSNGFYLNTSNAAVNGNGNSYIFAAWASAPFKYSNAR